MHYSDKREAKVKIYYTLIEKGWNCFGFSPDESDSMTDYYCPAHWDGIAEKNGYVLVIDHHNNSRSGYEHKQYNYNANKHERPNFDKIKKLQAKIDDQAAPQAEKDNCQALIKKEMSMQGNTYIIAEVYPSFSFGNPKSCAWHIEKDGQIIAKGKGVFSVNSYNWENETKTREEQKKEKLNSFIQRLESALQEAEALKPEIVKVPKQVTKPVEKDDKTINKGDILSFTYHGHYWIVLDVYTVGEQVRVTYECLGSAKRGYKRVNNTKRYYQPVTRLQKEMNEGKVKVYTLQEATEYEEKTIYKKTARKQTVVDAPAIDGEVNEETNEENKKETKETKNETNNTYNDNESKIVATYIINEEKNGIEITFNNKPEKSTLETLKAHGFRWHKYNHYWYAVNTTDRLGFVQNICGSMRQEEQAERQTEAVQQETPEHIYNADCLADILTDYIVANARPETDEQLKAAQAHLLDYMSDTNKPLTDELLQYVQNEYEFMYSIIIYNSEKAEEPAETDPYAFKVDTVYKYHDIHFKAWNMEVEQIEPYLKAQEIPFYIAGDKFICKGLTIEQVQFIEGLNESNQAILFYDDKYNEINNNSNITDEPQNQNENTISSSDNVIYHNFTNNQINEKETETENMIDDDYLSKFDNIEVTNESRIAADDLEFCKEQENIYNKLIAAYNSFNEQLQTISALDRDTRNKYSYTSNGYKRNHDTTYYHSWKPSEVIETINKMKKRFISSVCYYFEKKYNITIDEEKIQKKYDSSITYENIIDEIYIQLDGHNFTEKAEQEIKEASKETVRNADKITIKNSKLILDSWFAHHDSIWREYRLNSKSKEIFNALQHFENGSIKGNEELNNKYVGYDNERNPNNFERYEPITLNKVKSIKFLKNGKLEIEFTSNQQAVHFAKVYCGYNQKSA